LVAGDVVAWQLWDNNASWLSLTNALVEEETLNSNLEEGVGDVGPVLGLPVKGPLRIDRYWQVAIGILDQAVSEGRDTSLQAVGRSLVNQVRHSPNEEHLKERGKVRPNVAVDLNVDIESVDVHLDVHTGNVWQAAVTDISCSE
jgi:hypothetical protein